MNWYKKANWGTLNWNTAFLQVLQVLALQMGKDISEINIERDLDPASQKSFYDKVTNKMVEDSTESIKDTVLV